MSSRRRRSLLAFLVASLAAGCASPGEPTARRPIVPQAVQDLQARQQGDEVVLSFTLPSRSTRDEPLAVPPAIEIYRGTVAPGGGPAGKTSTRLLYTIPGELTDSYGAEGRIVYRDAISASTVGSGSEQVYAVRTRAARNRASAESNRVTMRLYAPPPAVGNVSARIAGQSVMVTWPREANAEYRVYRAEIAPESAATASTDASQAVLRMPLVQVAQIGASVDGPLVLQYQDHSVELGHAYLYVVRRLAQYGDATVESADSRPAVITMVEAVAPAAPQNLEAVVTPAAAPEPASVSLVWAIASETDVAGYVVYRSDQEGVRGMRLNEQLLGSPTYRDTSVAAGRSYFYSVTAVDRSEQESAPSTTVEVQIPGLQP
jgi:hypothetical protein